MAPLYSELGKSFLNISTYNELQWSLLDTSIQTGLESITEIHEHAFQNLKKATVIPTGIVLYGVAFLKEYGVHPHLYTDEQWNRMKQDLVTILQNFGQIQAINVFLAPALEEYNIALSINIETCGGEFHKLVAQSHHCLARVHKYYATHLFSSKEVIRDRRVVRFDGDRGQMEDDIPLNNNKKSAEHCFPSGEHYAGPLTKICQSHPEEIITVNKLDTIYDNMSKLKNPPRETDKLKNRPCETNWHLFEYRKTSLYEVKARLDETEQMIETIKTK